MQERIEERLDKRQVRIARNEAAFRETNEQIDALNAAGARVPEIPIVCECGSAACLDVFTVAAPVYGEVRADSARFLLKPGHEASDVESVVARHAGFVVVEKKPGAPRRVAEETDPRADEGVVDDEVARRIAENESRFRAANERIEEAVLRLEADAPTLPFVCECGRLECLKIVRLGVDEYEQARESPRFFLCAPGHAIVGRGLGRVVRQTSKFVIVEKLGQAGVVAEDRDPRSEATHEAQVSGAGGGADRDALAEPADLRLRRVADFEVDR